MFKLCRDVYRCTPEQLNEVDALTVEMHLEFIAIQDRIGNNKSGANAFFNED